MYIICNVNNVIISVSEEVISNPNGSLIANGAVMGGDLKTYNIEGLPDNSRPDKYCYTVEDGFYLNPDYVPSLEETIEELRQGQSKLILMLVEGGVI